MDTTECKDYIAKLVEDFGMIPANTQYPKHGYCRGGHPICTHLINLALAYNVYDASFSTLMVKFDPAISEENPNFLSYCQSSNKFRVSEDGVVTELRTRIKPGRLLSKLFPIMTQKELTTQTREFIRLFMPIDYTVTFHQDQDSFRHAYRGEVSRCEDIDTDDDRKSIAASCMRYSFDYLEHHPSEAYATGDFTIAIAKDNDGLIAGRCVIAHRPDGVDVRGPIYGTTEKSIDLIETEIIRKYPDVKCWEDGYGWTGCKLHAWEHEYKGFIACYLDVSESANLVNENGNLYLEIIDGGLVSMRNHETGLQYASKDYCRTCYSESSISTTVMEVLGSNYYGDRNYICSCCAEKEPNIVRCHSTGLWCDDPVEVYLHNEEETVAVSRTHGLNFYRKVMKNGEEVYAHRNLCVSHGDEWVLRSQMKDHGLVECSLTGEVNKIKEMVKIDDGRYITKITYIKKLYASVRENIEPPIYQVYNHRLNAWVHTYMWWADEYAGVAELETEE